MPCRQIQGPTRRALGLGTRWGCAPTAIPDRQRHALTGRGIERVADPAACRTHVRDQAQVRASNMAKTSVTWMRKLLDLTSRRCSKPCGHLVWPLWSFSSRHPGKFGAQNKILLFPHWRIACPGQVSGPCLVGPRSPCVLFSYGNTVLTQECYEYVVMASKNLCQTRPTPTLIHKVYE